MFGAVGAAIEPVFSEVAAVELLERLTALQTRYGVLRDALSPVRW